MKKRMIALTLCIVLCAVMAFSYAYIVLETEHDCTGEHCHICVELQICHSLIQNLSYAVAAIAIIAYAAHPLISACIYVFATLQACTLVSLKVKLLN